MYGTCLSKDRQWRPVVHFVWIWDIHEKIKVLSCICFKRWWDHCQQVAEQCSTSPPLTKRADASSSLKRGGISRSRDAACENTTAVKHHTAGVPFTTMHAPQKQDGNSCICIIFLSIWTYSLWSGLILSTQISFICEMRLHWVETQKSLDFSPKWTREKWPSEIQSFHILNKVLYS